MSYYSQNVDSKMPEIFIKKESDSNDIFAENYNYSVCPDAKQSYVYSEMGPQSNNMETLPQIKTETNLETISFEENKPAINENECFPKNGDNTVDKYDAPNKSGHYDNSYCTPEEEEEEEEDELKCKICRKVFATEGELLLHVKENQLEKLPKKCCACGKSFRDNYQLKLHGRSHTGEQPYECEFCGKKFSINGNLSKHLMLHTGERPFQCKICQRTFTQFAHLEDHLLTHSRERPFQCDTCMATFKTKIRLKKHIKCHDDGQSSNTRSIRCSMCDKILKSTRQFIDHVRTHTDSDHRLPEIYSEHPFVCPICFKAFQTLYGLQNHQNTHSGVKAFQCTLCNRSFNSSSRLRRHVNSHAGIKPFSCELCSKSFPSTQNLKRHMLTHTDIKPYSCDVCAKGFLTVENLSRHKRIHTGEKPYSCDTCGKSFAHSTTLKEHQLLHSDDRPFVCSVCNKGFTANKLLSRHYRQKHPESYDTYKNTKCIPSHSFQGQNARPKIQKSELDSKAGLCNSSRSKDDSSSPQEFNLTTVKNEVESEFDCNYQESKVFAEADEDKCSSSTVGGYNFTNFIDVKPNIKIESNSDKEVEENVSSSDYRSNNLPIKVENVSGLNNSSHDTFHHENRKLTEKLATLYPCTMCKRSLKTAASLERHLKNHYKQTTDKKLALAPKRTAEKPLECSDCHKQFISKHFLSKHIASKHGGAANIIENRSSSPVDTPQVDPAVSALAVAALASMSSSGGTCEICNKSYQTMENLNHHKRIHLNSKPYQCGVCEERFSLLGLLHEHQWVHKGDIPFACSICGEQFSSTRELCAHLRVHQM